MKPNSIELAQFNFVSKGRRKFITILFSDVSGSSEHAERLDAEEYAELLERFREFAHGIIPDHGGTIARLQGDGLLALFGHIDSREDDGRRATEAALEIHAAVNRLRVGRGAQSEPMRMHSGIHSGLVLLLEGDIERGRFDVVGEVPNTAARLCNLAQANEILVTDETLGPNASFFQRIEFPALKIRGRTHPANVSRIEGRTQVGRRSHLVAGGEPAPCIGRELVLSELSRAASRVQGGEFMLVRLVGEAGIGKTRVIDAFQSLLDRSAFRVLSGYCESYLGAQPLQPIIHWLRSALKWRSSASVQENEATAWQALTETVGERAREFSDLIKVLLGSKDTLGNEGQGRSPSTIPVPLAIEFLCSLAARQSLVLILDDWQWVDDATRNALTKLRAKGLPMLLVLATRPVTDDEYGPEAEAGKVLQLTPLNSIEGERAVSVWLPNANPFVVQEIYRLSGGSPLFIEELCHAARGGELASFSRPTNIAWINSLVASRFARLSESQANYLRIASVIGNVFPEWLMQRILGVTEADTLFQEIENADFLLPDRQLGVLRFKHILTRDAIYATVDLQYRRALHQRVAQEIIEHAATQGVEPEVESLSYHLYSADDIEHVDAYAEAAGDKALNAMSLDRARAQYITALQALDRRDSLTRELKLRWCLIAQKLGQTCVFDPLDVSYGFKMFERAARLAREAGDVNSLARAHYWLGYVNYGRGQPKDSVRHCEIALESAIASNDQRLVAQVHATLGQALASAGQYDRAIPLMKEAVESKRQQSRPGSGTAIGSGYTLGRLAYTLGDLGRFDEAHEVFQESLHLLGPKLHSVIASVRELMCVVFLWQGRWIEARDAGGLGAEIAMQCRSRYLVAMGRALGACGVWALEESEGSMRMLRDSTDWIEARGGAVSTSLNYGWLVEACVTLGREAEARKHAAKLFGRARASDRHGQAIGCRALARMAGSKGEFGRAEHYLVIADNAAAARGSVREQAVNLLARAQLAAQRSNNSEARNLAEDAGAKFERLKMPSYCEKVRLFLGNL